MLGLIQKIRIFEFIGMGQSLLIEISENRAKQSAFNLVTHTLLDLNNIGSMT